MAEYSVYIHTNRMNGKTYIGITSQKPTLRWKNGQGYKACPRFYPAIKKYGWDGFEHDVISTGISKESAESMEKELIKLYKSNMRGHGYNIEKGGSTSKLSEQQKQHLSEINTGKKHSEETKQKMSKSHLGRKYSLGFKQRDETKKKRAAKLSSGNNGRAQQVFQYNLNGDFVKVFDCMQDAVKELNAKSSCHISDCCRDKRAQALGFMWSYELKTMLPYFKGNKREVRLIG